jgi:uncharacterized metal-binding protein YceD (DUF177 family)
LLFELITLSIPNQRQHKKNKNGYRECNKETSELIKKYTKKGKLASDPRWDALKKLKD